MACGPQPTAQEQQTFKKEEQPAIQYQPENPKEVVVEYRKDGEQYAIALNDTSELPECTHANNRQIAYIKPTEQFFSCESESWQEISVKGKIGETGQKGDKGDKGEPGEPTSSNQWFDPISKKTWLIGASANYAMTKTYYQACTGEYKLPSRAEATEAAIHGLGTAFPALQGSANGVWTNDPGQTDPALYAYVILMNGSEAEKSIAESHGVACLKIEQ